MFFGTDTTTTKRGSSARQTSKNLVQPDEAWIESIFYQKVLGHTKPPSPSPGGREIFACKSKEALLISQSYTPWRFSLRPFQTVAQWEGNHAISQQNLYYKIKIIICLDKKFRI